MNRIEIRQEGKIKAVYIFNLIRFYKWGININTYRIKNRLSYFIIHKRIKSLDNFFKKRSACYHETLCDFYDGAPYYNRHKITGKLTPLDYWEDENINPEDVSYYEE